MAFNSSIIIKAKICKSCGNKRLLFSKGRCQQCASREDSSKRISKHEEQEQDESLQNLIQDADAVFSKYIRLKAADSSGNIECFVCHKKLPIAEAHNSHYISRSNMSCRFLVENCTPSCPDCNRIHNDNRKPYTDALEASSKGITQWLMEQGKEVVRPTREEIRAIITDCRFKIKILQNKLKNK